MWTVHYAQKSTVLDLRFKITKFHNIHPSYLLEQQSSRSSIISGGESVALFVILTLACCHKSGWTTRYPR
jgi:hypothetical protein